MREGYSLVCRTGSCPPTSADSLFGRSPTNGPASVPRSHPPGCGFLQALVGHNWARAMPHSSIWHHRHSQIADTNSRCGSVYAVSFSEFSSMYIYTMVDI